ncbi:MAG: alanine racemase [Gemmatimonadetes bacterium]|nr:alanine racemase [Gemmatimonadota bacterium]
MHIDELDTPAYVADLDVMERNIASMAKHCRNLGIALRCHTKSHKIPEIAHRQVGAGAIGICCQKLGEAEVMAAAGIENILVPYNIVGPRKVERLTRVARRTEITVAVDDVITAQGTSDRALQDGCRVNVIIELDTGTKRCGVQSPEAAADLAERIMDLRGLAFKGVMIFPSPIEAKGFLRETVERITEKGIPIEIISGGGTGGEENSKAMGCTETRSGSYIWEGMSRIGNSGMLNAERCACRMIVTVVSAPTPDRIIIDGGMKTFASYPPTPYGHIIEHPEAEIYGMSVEHGHVDVSRCAHRFKVGERLSIIPLHQEMALNLHDELNGVRGEQVEVVWPVAGRGKVK